jgi:hypothetical protein
MVVTGATSILTSLVLILLRARSMHTAVAVPAIDKALPLQRELGGSQVHKRRAIRETKVVPGRLILLAAIVIFVVMNLTSRRPA